MTLRLSKIVEPGQQREPSGTTGVPRKSSNSKGFFDHDNFR
jgi:hypothetical protein